MGVISTEIAHCVMNALHQKIIVFETGKSTPKTDIFWLVYFNVDITPIDCPSKSISKTLYPPWLYINDCFVQQKSAIFLGKWTNFLKFLTSCLAKGDYAPSFPTEKFGQNGENYSPLHYLNHNRYYRGEGGRMLRTTIFHHTSSDVPVLWNCFFQVLNIYLLFGYNMWIKSNAKYPG